MAIVDALPGVSVSINVNGVPAKEYTDPNPAQSAVPAARDEITTVTYIETVADATFRINVAVDESFDPENFFKSLSFEVFLDGRFVETGPGNLFEHDSENQLLHWEIVGQEAGMKGQNKKRFIPFKFSELEIVEDLDKDRIKKDKERSKDLGEIRVEVIRINVSRVNNKKQTMATIRKRNRLRKNDVDLELAEKALKGKDVTHGIVDGDDEILKDVGRMREVEAITSWDDPVAIFKFRYRSRDALKKALILDLEDFSRQELLDRARDLQRQQRLMGPRQVKKEGGIKRERIEDGEDVIDLTQDAPKRPRVEIDLTDD